MFVHEIAKLVEPWNQAYSDSKLLAVVVTGVHLLAMLVGGGLAIAADRRTLRVTRVTGSATERAEALDEIAATHRPVLVALAFLFLSGVALALADVETFFPSPAFWVKLGLVALLLVNGAVLSRTEARLRGRMSTEAGARDPLWGRMRATAVASIALWAATLVAGTVLVNAA